MSDSDADRHGGTRDVDASGNDRTPDRAGVTADTNGSDAGGVTADPAGPDAGEKSAVTDASETADGVDDDAETNVSVEELDPRIREPIEPESPSAENALFVFLGVLGTVVLLASAIFPGVI